MASTAQSPNLRATFVATFNTFVHDLFGDYRPELHYMRGPGPKWHEKHGQKHGHSEAATPLFPDSVPA
jgi:hypothetical protein